ncbi:LOW QUALITY PROTEIN: transmembrane emp24 domain-containing protein p24delta5 [Manihot esculenta]|uniref:GOLD domain-containing protein n=1 Tax=Manihot esculenta TaxID=3983 RepID=A0A2C9U1F6_MANES|nr:LOW QUALITY PROTEIN: transmembrane emp24 domain-containing protein p24delta5 [Manihot esculenta]
MAEKSHSPDTVAVLSLFLLCSIFCNINLIPVAEAIWLSLPSSGTKCVSEEIQNSVVVLADYFVINENRPEHIPTVSARVTSPYGNNLYHNENASHGQFAFTTSEAGNYMACFWLDSHQPQSGTTTLSLDWKIGIAAKDWDSVARKEKIEGVELDLMRLEGVVQSVHNNVIYLREKEAEMREVSERTNARVAWFSIMSLGVSIAVSVLQLWHLKRYFQKKKLI